MLSPNKPFNTKQQNINPMDFLKNIDTETYSQVRDLRDNQAVRFHRKVTKEFKRKSQPKISPYDYDLKT
jgi:hypothetical protein